MEETMKEKKHAAQESNRLTRRSLLRSASAAALVLSTGPLERVTGQSPSTLTNYGPSSAGKTELVPETIFPLFAAWLLLTTNGPFHLDENLLSCTTRIHPESAAEIIHLFDSNAAAFKPVRVLFEQLAKKYAASKAPYSGGQCPTVADTVTPVAGLLGTSTTVVCQPATKSSKKPK
jgi:hypothetical protein